jgi:high-affinity nickel permease
MLQLLLTVYAGFTHAFETDHLLAVSNIVSNRQQVKPAIKDGIFWGLGHTSTIIVIGVLMIMMKKNITPVTFHYFESAVGLMLIALAVFRLWKLWNNRQSDKNKTSRSYTNGMMHTHTHQLAFSVGLVHGLAGSGAMVVLVLSQIKKPADGIIYLLIFCIGSIFGMLLAAGLFSLPFSKRITQSAGLKILLVLMSSVFCIVYGGKVIYENMVA